MGTSCLAGRAGIRQIHLICCSAEAIFGRPQSKAANGEPLRVETWYVYPGLNRVTCDEAIVQVESQVMIVLDVLAGHAGAVITHNPLLDTVWADTVLMKPP